MCVVCGCVVVAVVWSCGSCVVVLCCRCCKCVCVLCGVVSCAV